MLVLDPQDHLDHKDLGEIKGVLGRKEPEDPLDHLVIEGPKEPLGLMGLMVVQAPQVPRVLRDPVESLDLKVRSEIFSLSLKHLQPKFFLKPCCEKNLCGNPGYKASRT